VDVPDMKRVLFKVDFWIASLIAGLALIANGLIADWEDRRRDRGP